jgi:hypothetical protein
MNKLVFAAVSTIMTFSIFAAPYVTNVVAKQRYPWGIVDISCDVKGIEESREIGFSIEAVLPDLGVVKKASAVRFLGAENSNSDGLVAAKDGNYRFVWNANADIGSAHYTNIVVRIGIYKNPKKVQLWKDGPYWAEMNIGANEPWELGYYFWWGDTIGYKIENYKRIPLGRWLDGSTIYKPVNYKWVASDGSSSNFSFVGSNTPTDMKDISTLKNEGWITAEGVLAPQHDAAKKHWGGNWRMPTKQEFDELNSKCDWTRTRWNGVKGYVIRGRGDYASNSIFLPCAGCVEGVSLVTVGSLGAYSFGTYWSSVPDPDGHAWYLDFCSSGYPDLDSHESDCHNRYNGRSVRPLQGFTK